MTEAGRYRPEIDGLRALAVVPVVFFHAGIPGFSGGFVGVDIFFVISGFLITRIIHSELVAGNFSIVHFYERRARRILPALTVVLAAATGVAMVLMSAPDLIDYAKSLAATALFASNFWFWRQAGGYFEPDVETHPLLHTWSLAVEEQFYIVFPLLLIACMRFFPARVRLFVALVSAASFALAVWLVRTSPNAAFYLAPGRAWELGLGAMLALGMVPAIGGRLRELPGVIGLALIVGPVLLYTGATPFPGLAALLPCLGAALILYSGTGSAAGRALAWRPLVFIGLVSYSFYLWHWPVIVLLKGVTATARLPIGWGLAAIAVSFVLAVLSWRFIERPFRSSRRFSRRQIFLFSAAGIASVLALAAGLWVLRGVPARFSPADRALIEARYDRNPRRAECLGRAADSFCRVGAEGAAPSFLLWGDSHADSLQPAAELAAGRAGAAGYIASHEACAPLIGVGQDTPGCTAAQQATIAWLDRHPEIRLVVLAARWPLWRTGSYVGEETGPPHPLLALTTAQAGQPQGALFDQAAAQTVRTLTAMNRRVVILGSVPEIGWDVPTRLFAARHFGTAAPPAPTMPQVTQRQWQADHAFLALGAEYLPLAPYFCDPACRLTTADGKPLYVDDDHLSAAGARAIVTPVLEPVLRSSR